MLPELPVTDEPHGRQAGVQVAARVQRTHFLQEALAQHAFEALLQARGLQGPVRRCEDERQVFLACRAAQVFGELLSQRPPAPFDHFERALDPLAVVRANPARRSRVQAGQFRVQRGPALDLGALVEAATDNRNRTVAEVRNVLMRAGGNLGESGSVAWNFESRGVLTLEADGSDPDDIAMRAIDAGAVDVLVGDGAIDVYTEPAALEDVRKLLEEAGLAVKQAEQTRVPKTTVQLDEKAAMQTLGLVEKLESLDDVQKVYFNAEFGDEVLAAYAS